MPEEDRWIAFSILLVDASAMHAIISSSRATESENIQSLALVVPMNVIRTIGSLCWRRYGFSVPPPPQSQSANLGLTLTRPCCNGVRAVSAGLHAPVALGSAMLQLVFLPTFIPYNLCTHNRCISSFKDVVSYERNKRSIL
jgi:hypothetical protein